MNVKPPRNSALETLHRLSQCRPGRRRRLAFRDDVMLGIALAAALSRQDCKHGAIGIGQHPLAAALRIIVWFEAMAEAKLAFESDPLSSYAHSVYGFVCGYAEEYAAALEVARRAVEFDSESYLARVLHQEILRVTGEFEESEAIGELALAVCRDATYGAGISRADLRRLG